jgi:hypothetical protein
MSRHMKSPMKGRYYCCLFSHSITGISMAFPRGERGLFLSNLPGPGSPTFHSLVQMHLVGLMGFVAASCKLPGIAEDQTANYVLWAGDTAVLSLYSVVVSVRLLCKIWAKKRPANWPEGLVAGDYCRMFDCVSTGCRVGDAYSQEPSCWDHPMSNDADARADLVEVIARLYNLATRRVRRVGADKFVL